MTKKYFTLWLQVGSIFLVRPLLAEESVNSSSHGSGIASAESPRENEEIPPPDPDALKRRIDEAARALSGEPTLAELRQAALRHADADKPPTERWKRRVRLASILPTIKVGADFGESRDEALDRYQDDPDRWGADTSRGLGADMTVQWKLDRLVFNTDEIKVYDSLADRAVRRENLLTLLINVYFERRRLQLEEMLLAPENMEDALERSIRIEELTETLDALTGGRMSQNRAQKN